jgi:uncharacterized NAD(P)/FAD-binding protein YdhS
MTKPNKPCHVVIVGAGFSGAMTALHLIKQASTPLKITIFEPRAIPGLGMAYSTPSNGHLLNVPASGMSAFVDDAEHFQRYATTRNASTDAHTFVPRRTFGEYISGMVKDAIAEAPSHIAIEHRRETVVNISHVGGEFDIGLNGGEHLTADYVVLALGNLLGKKPRWLRELGNAAENYLHDPWQAGAIEAIKPDENILLIGMGLTAVDKLVELDLQKHKGTIYANSRHGLWPSPHVARLVSHKEPGKIPEGNVAIAVKSLRDQMRIHEKTSGDPDAWRVVFDGLRSQTQDWWQSLAPKEHARFLRHVKTYYAVHRHRMAPEIGAVVERMIKSGQVKSTAARVTAVSSDGDKLRVTLTPRHGKDEPNVITVDRIINCMGPLEGIDAVENPLLRTVVANGLAGRNDLGSGIAVTNKGAVLSPDGVIVPGLYAIGPLLISKLLESVAVPELSVQAVRLAKQLLDSIEAKAPSTSMR